MYSLCCLDMTYQVDLALKTNYLLLPVSLTLFLSVFLSPCLYVVCLPPSPSLVANSFGIFMSVHIFWGCMFACLIIRLSTFLFLSAEIYASYLLLRWIANLCLHQCAPSC